MRGLRDRIGQLHRPTVFKTLGALAALGAVGAAAVVGLGLYNVSARDGHWPGVSWLLHTTFRNAVALRASGTEPPENLRSQTMIALGAGHFDSACRHCHASPGETRAATVRAMTPQPPHVVEAVGDWTPEELHWIVSEGVKMSGMPGWPAERTDDVWPVVSFLLAVRDGMDAATYSGLTDHSQGPCVMCHGENGASDNPEIPRLDILSEDYIARSLAAYRDGARDSGIMAEAASTVSETEIRRIVARFAGVTPEGRPAAPSEAARRGRALAAEGGTDETPSCNACHGPWPETLNPAFPSLAGQHEPYLRRQLELWRNGRRGGSAAAKLMHHAARDLTDDEIAAVSAYYAALAPAKLDDASD